MNILPWRNPNPIEATLSTCKMCKCEYDEEACPKCIQEMTEADWDLNNDFQNGLDR